MFFVAFILGEIAGLIAGTYLLLVIPVTIGIGAFVIYKGLINKGIFFIGIIFLTFGFFLIKQTQSIYDDFDKKCEIDKEYSINGLVYKIEEADYGNVITVKTKKGYFYVYSKEAPAVFLGNEVLVCGKIKQMNIARNPGNFNEKNYLRSNHVIGKLDAISIKIVDEHIDELAIVLEKTKEELSKSVDKIIPEESGILKAMLFGNKEDLESQTKSSYRQAGIIHILAISGLHISTVGMMIFNLLRKKFTYYTASIISGSFMLGFAILTGGSVSTKRAVIMFTLSLISKILGMAYDIKTSVSIAGIILLMDNPYYIFNTSFLLTLGTVIGIAFISPVLENSILGLIKNKSKGIERFIKTIILSVSINLTTMPLILFMYNEIPTYSIVINLVVIPLMSIVLCMGLLGTVLGLIWIKAGIFFVGINAYILRFFQFICSCYTHIPGNTIISPKPDLIRIISYYICLVIFVAVLNYYPKKAAKKIIAFMLLLICILFVCGKNERIVVIDVGQGDCTFIQAEGASILIDGGSSDVKNVGEYRIAPAIRSYGVNTLDAVFISHTDSDHINGIEELIEKNLININKVILPMIDEESTIEFILFLKEYKIPYIQINTNEVIKISNMSFYNLSPKEAKDNINSKSLVLLFCYNNYRALFTGDISKDEELKIIGSLSENTNIDLLKIAHHGSNSASCKEFIRAIKPKAATISCGVNNSYGHPHKEVINLLEVHKVDYYITAQAGAIIINHFLNEKVVDILTYIN